jgi:hypothetical protein
LIPCNLLIVTEADMFSYHLFPPALVYQIQLKTLAEEMQAVSKGLEKVEQELTTSVNDGAISTGFQKVSMSTDAWLHF